MTRIVLQKQGENMRVSAAGHATGSAAACAGVSAILFALCGYLHEDGAPGGDQPIVEPWKCPYHNGRMCMEFLRRNPAL